jgi:mannobiose 2-epimerase
VSVSNAQKPASALTANERVALAEEMELSLQKDLLERWYPTAVDSVYGGFLSTFTFDFKPTGSQDKFIVTQARHTWTNAMAAMRYPGSTHYLQWAKHGFWFLREVLWDKMHGGFYSLVTRNGEVKNEDKTTYGNAFAIYALATYYKASGDTAALALVKKAFHWLERHSHDPINKGYFQHLQRNGTPLKRNPSTLSTSDLGYKDQNSSIHLLEAFTALYEVWKDGLVKERLGEMLLLIRDRITTSRGSLTLFLQPDWTPVSFRDSSRQVVLKHKNLDHISFGHDVETAYLMLEASHVIGLKNDSKTRMVAKRMVDHALQNGWDKALGGFYNEGYYFKGDKAITIIFDSKNWWAQAEGLNTLLLMADLFPTDKMNYAGKFRQQWQYIQTYLIDHEHGDWYEEGLDKEPHRKSSLKGHQWKAAYHQYRALANCIDQLRSRLK